MRCFLAVPIPVPVQSEIANLQKWLAPLSQYGKIKWVQPHNLHLTLKFYGEIQESSLSQLCEAVQVALESHSSFQIQFSGLGAFPNFSNAKVLWVGTKIGAKNLLTCAYAIENLSESVGFAKSEHEFKPHLTIARLPFLKDKRKLQEISQPFINKEFPPFNAEKLSLIHI